MVKYNLTAKAMKRGIVCSALRMAQRHGDQSGILAIGPGLRVCAQR
jgi:hypothetical protein